jgi:molybdopterin/thiamine biosynthesis adenylyltransferase
MSTAKARTAHAKAILGPELHQRLADTKVLLVGAGGIGCELREYLENMRRLLRLTIAPRFVQ